MARGEEREAGARPPLAVWQAVEVGLPDGEGGVRWHASRLEGHDAASGWVTVAWPMDQLSYVRVQVGQSALLGAPCSGDGVYMAEAAVEHATLERPARIVLRLTGGWRRVQRRQAVRLPVSILPREAALVVDDEPRPLIARIRDLSAGGVRLRCDREVRPGDRLALAFSLPGERREMRVRVEVRRVCPGDGPAGQVWDAGCRFLDASERDQDAIVRFIFAQQRTIAQRLRDRQGG